MPVYNGSRYLGEAIESVLNQTFKNFEFLIIDDGSTDNSINIIKSYDDDRIRLVVNKKNIGQSTTLNKGIDLALGEYIARMDQDDIYLIKKLEEQIIYLNNNPEISVLGTWFKSFRETGTKKIFHEIKLPEDPNECAFWMYFLGNQPVGHPCVMFNKNQIKEIGGYNINYAVAQDVELWMRALLKGIKFSNVQKFLVYYRLHNNQGSKSLLAESEHNYALGKFLTTVIDRSINSEQSARYRANNLNDIKYIFKEEIREHIELKKNAINKYSETYKIPNSKILKYSILIWRSLQGLGKLKIASRSEMTLRNTIFCLEFLNFQLKNNRLLYYKRIINFIIIAYWPIIRRIYNK